MKVGFRSATLLAACGLAVSASAGPPPANVQVDVSVDVANKYDLRAEKIHVYGIKNDALWETHGLVELTTHPSATKNCKPPAIPLFFNHDRLFVQFDKMKSERRLTLFLTKQIPGQGAVNINIDRTLKADSKDPKNVRWLLASGSKSVVDDVDYFIMMESPDVCSNDHVDKTYLIEAFPTNQASPPSACDLERPDNENNWQLATVPPVAVPPYPPNTPSCPGAQSGTGVGTEPNH
jgi:hypothetical protein